MNRLIVLLLVMLSSNSYSTTNFRVLSKDISIEDKCIYYVRDVKSAGFSCHDAMENRYSISFSVPDEVKKSYSEREKTLSADINIDKNIHKKLGGYEHYYTQLSDTKSDFILYGYQICGYQACILVSSPKKSVVFEFLRKFEIELIEY